MKRRLTLFALLLAWLLSLGAVFLLGLFSAFAFHQAPGTGNMEDESIEDRAYAVLTARLLGEPVEWTALKDGGRSQPVPDQVRALLVRLDREPDPARRAVAVETIAEAFPSRKVGPAIQALLGDSASRSRDALLASLFGRWGAIDPRSALDFTQSALTDPGLRRTMALAALRGWAGKHPEAAWEWVTQRSDAEPGPAERYLAVLGAGRGVEAATAASWLGALEDQALAERVAAREAVRRLSAQGAREALSFAETVTEDYAGRTELLAEVLEAWAALDPTTSRRWFEQLPPEEHAWALPALGAGLPLRGGRQALSWVGSQAASPARDLAVREASGEWLRLEGPAALGTFLNQVEDLAPYGPAVELLALDTMVLDPETALSWASLIPDQSRRSYAEAAIGSYWLSAEPEAARAALARRDIDTGLAEPQPGPEDSQFVSAAAVVGERLEVAPGETLTVERGEDSDPVYVEIVPQPEADADAEAEEVEQD